MKLQPGLQGMRGLAALAVVLYHTGHVVFHVGFVGVDLFFVLSGFILSRKMLDGDYPDLKTYYSRRIFRIWPTYWLGLLALAAVGIAGLSIYEFGFIQFWHYGWSPSNPTWTLCIEEVFYAVLPLWLICFRGWRRWVAVSGTLALAGVWTALTLTLFPLPLVGAGWMMFHQLPEYAFDYAMGTLVAVGSVPKLKPWMVGALTVPALLYFFWAGDGVFVPPVAAVLFAFWVSSLADLKVFTQGPLQRLGALTYPVYLFGLPVTVALSAALPRWDGSWLLVGLVVLLTVAVAALVHEVVEKPGILLGKRLTEDRYIPLNPNRGNA